MTDSNKNDENSSLFMEFAEYFELSLAITETELAEVYQVRYRVYCEEFGYESTEAFSDDQEVDEFDQQSMHCLVRHKLTGRVAGCVRLVMVAEDQLMPMEKHCEGSLDQDFMSTFQSQRNTVGEISRLAVDGDFRRRRGEKETRFGATDLPDFTPGEKRVFPLIAVSLFLASAAVADIMGRKNCFAIMEPFLPVILRRTGVPFKRIGKDFEFRGIRAPYYASLSGLVNNAPDELRLCFYAVREQFARQLFPERSDDNGSREAEGLAAPGWSGFGKAASA